MKEIFDEMTNSREPELNFDAAEDSKRILDDFNRAVSSPDLKHKIAFMMGFRSSLRHCLLTAEQENQFLMILDAADRKYRELQSPPASQNLLAQIVSSEINKGEEAVF